MKVKLKRIIFLAIVLIALFSVPIVNIPLNDDYLYFDAVENLLKTGEVRISTTAAPSLLLQLFYSASFTQIFELSHTVLTVTTIILASIAILATSIYFRKFTSEKIAFIASAFLLFTPAFFNLSHTFMTDIPALSFAILSILAFHKGLQENKFKYIFLGSLFSINTFLIRQWYFLIPFAVAGYYFFNRRKELFSRKIFTTLIILPLIVYSLWFYWNVYVHGQSSYSNLNLTFSSLIIFSSNNIMKIIFFSSIFLFPIGVVMLLNFKKFTKVISTIKKRYILFIAFVVILQIVWMLSRIFLGLGIIFPGNNVLFWYTGLLTGIPGNTNIELLIPFIVLGIFATIFILSKIFQTTLHKNLIFLLTIAVTLPFIISIMPTLGIKDRYLLILIPLLFPIFLKKISEFRFFREVLIISVVFLAIWSWYGTYNYLNWNLVRDESLNFLKEFDGIEDIGGDAFRVKEPFAISIDKLEGYEILKEKNYHNVFGENLGTFYIMKK